MLAKVNIVVSCVKSKTSETEPSFLLRNHSGRNLAAIASSWIGKMQRSKGGLEAIALYKGDYWQIIRSVIISEIVHSGTTQHAEFWICSAGFGLIRPNTIVFPYSATFNPSDPDFPGHTLSGISPPKACAEWWKFLSHWNVMSSDDPRTIRDVVTRNADVPLIISVSQWYIEAIADDFLSAVSLLKNSDMVTILTSTQPRRPELRPYCIFFDARLQKWLGGARVSLSARVLRSIIKDLDTFSRPAIRDYIEEQSKGKHIITYKRTALSDSEIEDYVKREIFSSPEKKYTALLKKLRDSGCACERSRFKKIYERVYDSAQRGVLN